MRLEEAPPAGWYPDPERTGLLRWWEGTDWRDEHRSLPTLTELENAVREAEPPPASPGAMPVDKRRLSPSDTEAIVSQVRDVARAEVDRAAEIFSQRARTAIRQGRSTVSGYLEPVLRWVRIAIVLAALAVIAWFVLQFIAQAAFLSWLGDRIDSIT